MGSSFIHMLLCGSAVFSLPCGPLHRYSPPGGHLGYFWFGHIMNKAAANLVHVIFVCVVIFLYDYYLWVSQVALVVKNLPAHTGGTRDVGSILGLGRSPGVGNGPPTPVFLPGKFYGQRNLAGYSPWFCKESDMTERLGTTISKKMWEIFWRWTCFFPKWESSITIFKLKTRIGKLLYQSVLKRWGKWRWPWLVHEALVHR